MVPVLRHLAALMIALLGAAPCWAASKVALVLGNGAYGASSPLPNAANDARDMAQRLRDLGFDVYEGIDLSRLDTLRLIDAFQRAIDPEAVALFYFAGHGLQIGSENYLMPVDAEPDDEIGLTATSIPLGMVQRGMELRAASRIVILDACRNNPFLRTAASRSTGEASRGLSKVEAGVGSYIAFSTQPGNVALDGRGRNSPFTAALLRHIDSGEDIHAVMRRVRADVVTASNGTQVPWENSSLIDTLYLAAPGAARAGVPLRPLPQSAPVIAAAPNLTVAIEPPASLSRPAETSPSPRARPEQPGETCIALGGETRLCVSSTLAAQGGNSYGPENLLDNRADTAWVEGRAGVGLGETIALDLSGPATFRELDLINGYAKSATLHERNGRVAEVRVTASNGTEQRIALRDSAQWQQHPMTGFEGVTWLMLEVTDAIAGSRWSDTALSELRLR